MLYAPLLVASVRLAPTPGGAAPVRADATSIARDAAELRPLVRAVIAAILREDRDHPDVEDATHETIERAIAGVAKLRDGEALRPWVTGIARHVALDVLRSRKRARAREVPAPRESGETAPLDGVLDPAPSIDDRLGDAERLAIVRRAMEALPDNQRRALELFHAEGLGYQAIAARLGEPLGTVATWVTRARKQLEGALEEGGR